MVVQSTRLPPPPPLPPLPPSSNPSLPSRKRMGGLIFCTSLDAILFLFRSTLLRVSALSALPVLPLLSCPLSSPSSSQGLSVSIFLHVQLPSFSSPSVSPSLAAPPSQSPSLHQSLLPFLPACLELSVHPFSLPISFHPFLPGLPPPRHPPPLFPQSIHPGREKRDGEAAGTRGDWAPRAGWAGGT